MSQPTQRHAIACKPVVYRIPGMDAVTVQRDIAYKAGLTLDISYPANLETAVPAMVFVFGGSDPGAERILGCKFKEIESYIGWSRLTAASGMAAIAYTNRDPAVDAYDVIEYVRRNATALKIDASRIGIWACSGNVPLALSILMREAPKCAVFCYGYMLDLDGSTAVADATGKWGFVNPSAGKSVGDLPCDIPVLVVRAGQDDLPGLNPAIDRFVAEALRLNLPLTLINHPTGPHSFDVLDDSPRSQEIIRRILAFLRFHLAAAPEPREIKSV